MRWLSPGRLAAGKITVLDGDPGLGKSTLLCEFAARVSRGDPLPGGVAAPPRPVVIMSAEDDLCDTIRPRIDAAGGDPRRVMAFAILSGHDSLGTLGAIPDDVEIVENIIARTDAALLVIDPLVAFGPRTARDILREAREVGIGRNVLYAARKIEGVHIGKERVAGGRWVWSPAASEGEHLGVSGPQEVREVRKVRSDIP